MFYLAFLAAAAAASGSAPTPAPTPVVSVQAARPDPAAVAEATRMLDEQQFEENLIRSTNLMMGVSLASMVEQLNKQFGKDLPQDLVDQLRTMIQDHAMATIRGHMAELKRQAAEIYAREFTAAELVHLRELNADPVAVKARQRSAVMQPQLIKIGVDVMRSAEPELDAKIEKMVEDYLAAHGKTLPKDSSS